MVDRSSVGPDGGNGRPLEVSEHELSTPSADGGGDRPTPSAAVAAAVGEEALGRVERVAAVDDRGELVNAASQWVLRVDAHVHLEAAEVAAGVALVDVADQPGAGSSASGVQRGHATAVGGMMRSRSQRNMVATSRTRNSPDRVGRGCPATLSLGMWILSSTNTAMEPETMSKSAKKPTSAGAKAVSRRGIVVSSAYATKAAGGGKLTESTRSILREKARAKP